MTPPLTADIEPEAARDSSRLIDRRTLLTGLGATGLLAGFSVLEAGPAAAEGSPAPGVCRQLVTVNTASAGVTTGSLSAWQCSPEGDWQRVLGPFPAHVGDAGIGLATEGSTLTPAGTFPLTVAFGRQSNPGTAMSYFQTDPLDWWDENPSSPTYNLHVRQSSSPGGASENLYYSGSVYDYAVNISSNPDRIPGAGSAIFLHVTDGGPTAGCVSIDRSALVSVLRWLRPGQQPHAYLRVGPAWAPTRVPEAQARKFVFAVYSAVLHRPPTAGELSTRTRQIAAGANRAIVTWELSRSTENYRREVTRAFRAILGRDPSAATLVSGSRALTAGGAMSTLWAQVGGSDEAWRRSGRNADSWVHRVVPAAMGVTASTGGWAARARYSGPGLTAQAMMAGPSFGAHQVDLIYLSLLGRHANATDQTRFRASGNLRAAFDLPGLLAGGSEFWARVQR